MSVNAWLGEFEETLDDDGFRNAAARSVVSYIQRYAAQAAAFVEGRRDGARELVILEVRTGAPQRPFYPIRPTERIGILFAREADVVIDATASVVAARHLSDHEAAARRASFFSIVRAKGRRCSPSRLAAA